MLVLLGDADQLPSVDAGAVFRDLGDLAVRLGRSFRTDQTQAAGRRISECAARCVPGMRPASVLAHPAIETAELALDGVELVPGEREAVLDAGTGTASRRYPSGNSSLSTNTSSSPRDFHPQTTTV